MHYFSQFYSPVMPGFMLAFMPFLIVAAIWTIILKGFALWHAARAGQKGWFIALLVINTLGILEIVYLIWFRPSSPYASRANTSNTPDAISSPQA